MSTDSPSNPDSPNAAAPTPPTETAPATPATHPAAAPWIQRLPRWLWPLLKPATVTPDHAGETPPAARIARRWHFKTGALISLLLGMLVLGGVAGTLYSYQLFAKTLGEQSRRLDAQSKEMKKLGQEARQQAQAASESQLSLQQTRHQLENVQNQLNRTMGAMRAQAADLAKEQKEKRSHAGMANAPTDATTGFSGNCAVDANTPVESLSRCLEGLPQ